MGITELKSQVAIGTFSPRNVSKQDIVEICKELQDARFLFVLLSKYCVNTNSTYRINNKSGINITYHIDLHQEDLYYNVKRILNDNKFLWSYTIKSIGPRGTLNIQTPISERDKWLELNQQLQQRL